MRHELSDPAAELEGDASRTHRPQRLRRSASFSAYETLHGVWTAKDVIQSAGYPMEPHIVTTSDGYIMQMERIPRRGEPFFSADASDYYIWLGMPCEQQEHCSQVTLHLVQCHASGDMWRHSDAHSDLLLTTTLCA